MEMEVRSIMVNVRGLAAAAQSPTVITQADAVVQSVEAEAKAVEPRAPTTVERADVYVLPSGQAAGEGQRREDVPQASGQSPEGETRTRTRAPERSSSREAVTAKVANDDEEKGSSSKPSNQVSENSPSGSRPDTEGIDVVSAVSRQGHVAAMVFRPRMVHLSSPMNLARNSCRDGIDSWWIRSKFTDWPGVKWISNFLNSLIAEIDLFLGDSAPRTPCLEADLTRKG